MASMKGFMGMTGVCFHPASSLDSSESEALGVFACEFRRLKLFELATGPIHEE